MFNWSYDPTLSFFFAVTASKLSGSEPQKSREPKFRLTDLGSKKPKYKLFVPKLFLF